MDRAAIIKELRSYRPEKSEDVRTDPEFIARRAYLWKELDRYVRFKEYVTLTDAQMERARSEGLARRRTGSRGFRPADGADRETLERQERFDIDGAHGEYAGCIGFDEEWQPVLHHDGGYDLVDVGFRASRNPGMDLKIKPKELLVRRPYVLVTNHKEDNLRSWRLNGWIYGTEGQLNGIRGKYSRPGRPEDPNWWTPQRHLHSIWTLFDLVLLGEVRTKR